MITALELARSARARIATPDHWTKGQNYADANDMPVSYPGVACKYCAFGAIRATMKAQETDEQDWEQQLILEHALNDNVDERFDFNFIQFNDHPNTTHAMVLDLFDRTIARFEGATA